MQITENKLWKFAQAGGCRVVGGQPEKADYREYLDYNDLDEDGTPLLSEAEYNELQALDLLEIVADQYMSENHPGSEDIVGVAMEVTRAYRDGYAVHCWCGPNAEALVIGYRPNELTIVPTSD